jgi:hypothetical protein
MCKPACKSILKPRALNTRFECCGEHAPYGALLDSSSAKGPTASGLEGIGGKNTSLSQLMPLFLDAGCSTKYL